MPLVFLVPIFFAGLAALALPVLLHLRRREREKPMRFPSLMFLKKIPIVTARRRRITDLPLLFLRLLILALIVMAFARPVVRPKPGAVIKGTRRVVLLVDRSLSMSHKAVWPAAVDSAKAIINALAPGDRIAVVAFDEDAAVMQAMTIDHSSALAALGRIKPGARGTRYGAGLRAAREVFVKEADAAGGEILVVTDLQRSGSVGLAGLTLPPNIAVRAVPVSPKGHGNSAIASLDVQRIGGGDQDRGRLVVAARMITRGLAAPRKVHLAMTVNGRPSGERDATLPAEGTQSVGFDPVPMPVGEVRLVVTADPDSLPGDDVFRAVIPAQAVRRVILVTPPDLATDETLYLEHALSTGRDPAFRIERHAASTLDAPLLHDAAMVLLYDVGLPSGAAGTALGAWVHDGGGLVIAAGQRLASHGLSAPTLPGSVRGSIDRRDDRGGVFGDVALEHPVFAPFRGGSNATLGAARFFRYARMAPATDAQVLARFDDGLPALLEREDGSGRVLVVAAPLDIMSGDFPLQPTYLPFLRGIALYAAGHAAVPLWRTTGEGWLVPPGVRNPVVKSPSENLLRPDAQHGGGAVSLDEAGFYTVYDGRPSGDPLAVIATDPPARESDLSLMDARELLVGVGQDSVASSVISAATLTEAEGRQRIWRWLLVLVAIALVWETLVASRGWRGTAAQVVGAEAERSGA